MNDILNLPYLTVLDIKENNIDYHFTIETVAKPSFCPRCGGANIIGHGRDHSALHGYTDARKACWAARQAAAVVL